MNSHTEAFQRVIYDPWPDAPRRAFADRIDATDPQQSAYVRLALDLAKQRRWRASYADRSAIEAEMRKAASYLRIQAWSAPLLSVVGDAAIINFGRGFPEGITIDAAQFLEKARDIFAVAPILDLRLAKLADVGAVFFQSPHLSRIRSLDFADHPMTATLCAALADSPFLGRLRSLNLYYQPCATAGFEHLAASSLLPELQWVGGTGSALVDGVRLPTPDVNPIAREDESGVHGYDENTYAVSLAKRFGSRPWLSAVWNSHEAPHPEALSTALDVS